MIIGIDYRFAIKSNRGIAYCLRRIVAELMVLDQLNTYYLYVDYDVVLSLPPNFNIVFLNCKNLILFEQYALPKRAKRDGVELLWYSSNSGPIFLAKPIKLVVTIHDLVSLNHKLELRGCLTFRGIKASLAEIYRAFSLKEGLKRIDEIITVSSFSATQIERQLHRKPIVIKNHVHRLDISNASNQILDKLNLDPKRYIYTIAGVSKHKNLPGYIKVFQSGEMQYPLVISGVNDPALVNKYQSEFLIFTGEVTEAEKAALYANASVFLFLSHYEGFGLPILEAMQFQIPIVSSNKAALPEVLGDAGILVDPDDVKQIRAALIYSIDHGSDTMKMRQAIQYQKFSNWALAAKSHLRLFQRLGATE